MARLDMDEGAPGPGRAGSEDQGMTVALTAFCWGGASGSSLPLMIAFAVLMLLQV